MTKITLELIENAIQRTNPLKDRELDLKGNKISLIENLGTTRDQFDTLDFTDNEIYRLDGFPLLKRLKALNFTNNKIMTIGQNLEESIPNIDTLILINNNIADLRQIDNLASLKKLEFLSLMKNPVANMRDYRLYVIHKIPKVRILDFSRVKDKERQQAEKMYGGAASTKTVSGNRIKSDEKLANATPQQNLNLNREMPTIMQSVARTATAADMHAIKAAIHRATTMEEVDRLTSLLDTGNYIGFATSGGPQPQQQQQPQQYR